MKRCGENEKTYKLLDEELSEAERIGIEKHLSVCSECRVSYDSIRQTRTLLFAQPPVLPDSDFDKGILRLIEKKTAKTKAKAGIFSIFSDFPLKLGFASLIAALALGIAFELGRISAFSTPQNDLTQTQSTEKNSKPASTAEREIIPPPPPKIVTQIKTVTKYVQVPVIKTVKEEKIVYVGNPENTNAEIPVTPKRRAGISEEATAKSFSLKDLQPVGEMSYRIIRKGENNE